MFRDIPELLSRYLRNDNRVLGPDRGGAGLERFKERDLAHVNAGVNARNFGAIDLNRNRAGEDEK